MRKDISQLRIGIVGTGRLGRVLACRLGGRYPITAWDADIKKAKQFTKQHNLSFVNDAEQVLSSDMVLLCIPAQEVIAFFRSLDAEKSYCCKFLNLATDLDTEWLIQELGLERLSVIGLKLIGQFTALRYGLPAILVTSHKNQDDLLLLQEVFRDIGNIRKGDERGVGELNRAATRLALKFCREFNVEIKHAPGAEWDAFALKNVAVGTILDYPPDSNNAYTAGILRELEEDERESKAQAAQVELSGPVEVGK